MPAAKNKRQEEQERHERNEALRAERIEAEEEQEVRDAAIEERTERFRIDHEARKRLNSEITRQREFTLPHAGWTAEDFIGETDAPMVEVVQGLHYEGFNSLLVAEHKTGKTTLELGLAAALVDDKPFLGRFATGMEQGRVAFFNYEMDDRQFRQWLNESDIENIDRIVPLNLRGWQLPFWDDKVLLDLAAWLNDNEVKFIILDPASKAWRGLVDNESDNVQLAEFFGAIDTLKEKAGVPNLLLSVHTPRDADRARGGGEIEAWPDSLWYLTKVKGTDSRSLRAVGRDVAVHDLLLEFDPGSKSLTAGGSARKLADDTQLDAVVKALEDAEGQEFDTYAEFQSALKGTPGDSRAMIKRAVKRGAVIENEGKKPRFELPE